MNSPAQTGSMTAESEEHIDQLAQAIMNAITCGEQNEQQSSIKIFLVKQFKNNTAPKPKRMNSIRLSRINAVLYKAAHDCPSDRPTVEILVQSIYAMLLNDRNFNENEGIFEVVTDEDCLHAIARWTANLLGNICRSNCSDVVLTTLDYLLNNVKPTVKSLQQFQQLLQASEYFQTNEVTVADEHQALVQITAHYLCEGFIIREQILRRIPIDVLYHQLFKYGHRKQALTMFLKHVQITRRPNKLQLFLKCFLETPLASSEEVTALLQALQNRLFDLKSVTTVIDTMLRKQPSMQIISNAQIKGLKVEDIYIESVLEKVKKHPIEELVEIFLSSPNVNSYFILYLIAKSEERLPRKYSELLFDKKELFSNRRAIIFTFAIAQMLEPAAKELINWLIRNIETASASVCSLCLRSIHFALQSMNKANLFVNILKYVPVSELNKESKLEFVTLNALKPDQFDNEDRRNLSSLLKRHTDSDQEVFRIKIALYSLVNNGNDLPLLSTIKHVTELFEQPVEQIIRKLPNEREEYLEGILMGLNNRLEKHFVEESSATVQWAVKTYKSYSKEFHGLLKKQLEKEGKQQLYDLYAAIFAYNMETKDSLSFDESLDPLLTGAQKYKLQGSNFSDFYIKCSSDSSTINRLMNMRSLLIEIKKFVRFVTLKERVNNRKELKSLLEKNCQAVYITKIINFYFANKIADRGLLRQVFGKIKSEFEFFELVEKQAQAVNEEYYDLILLLPNLLRQLYPETIVFVARLIDSKPNQKKRKRKTKEAGDLQATHTVLFDNLDALFGDPALLENYSSLFKIIIRLKEMAQHELPTQLNRWLRRVRIFHVDAFGEWKDKVQSFCEMWSNIIVTLKCPVEPLELERHFELLTDLLNTLYQKYKQVKDMHSIEEKMLLTLLLMYQYSLPESMDRECLLPIEKLRVVLQGCRPNSIGEGNYFYCFKCSRQICDVCSSFVHKDHEKNFIGKDGTCSHSEPQRKKRTPYENKAINSLFQASAQGIRNRPLRRPINSTSEDQDDGENGSSQCEMDIEGHIDNSKRRRQQLYSREVMEGKLNAYRDQRQLLEKIYREQRVDRDRERIRWERQKEILEHLERNEEREKERLLEERIRIERFVDAAKSIDKEEMDILEGTEEEKGDPEEDKFQILSETEKSFRRISTSRQACCVFAPEFNPMPLQMATVSPQISVAPLGNLLLREMQSQINQFSNEDKQQSHQLIPLIKAQVLKERCMFFKSDTFKMLLRNQYSGRGRTYGSGQSTAVAKRNLLASNDNFMVYSSQNGLLVLNLSKLKQLLETKESSRNFGDSEKENQYFIAQQNTNLQFEPTQIVFSKANPNLLAVVGQTGISFVPISKDGKLQRMVDSNFDRSEPIAKFVWSSKNKNKFAFATGCTVHIAKISDNGSLKTSSHFTVRIAKEIRDFQIRTQEAVSMIYIVDVQGSLYRSAIERHSEISDKKIFSATPTEQVYSIFLFEERILVSLSNGTCLMLKVNPDDRSPVIAETLNFEAALKKNQNALLRNFKPPFYLSNIKLINESENGISFACIVRKVWSVSNDLRSRKIGGNLCTIHLYRGHIDIIMVSEDDSTYSYEVVQLGESSSMLFQLEENGSAWAARYSVPSDNSFYTDERKLSLTDQFVNSINKTIKENEIMGLMQHYEQKKCFDFALMKELTNHFAIATSTPDIIRFTCNQPTKYFITGILFDIEAIPGCLPCDFMYEFLGRCCSHRVERSRQIHLALTLKETLQLYTQQGKFTIKYTSAIKAFQGVRLFGVEAAIDSVYARAYYNVARIITLYRDYAKDDVEAYLANQNRSDISRLRISDLAKLKEKNEYSAKQLTLLLKMELLSQSLCQSSMSANASDLLQMLNTIRRHLLPLCQQRQYLENSCKRLIKACILLLSKGELYRVGHPFEYRTYMDLYAFERQESLWKRQKTLSSYNSLLKLLSELIYTRVGNLYTIMQLKPLLVLQLAVYFKTLFSQFRPRRGETTQHSSLRNRIANSCSMLISLICEHYQLLKNRAGSEGNPEEKVMSLLESIFCVSKKEFFSEIFLNPFLIFEKQYLLACHPFCFSYAVDFLSLASQEMLPALEQTNIKNFAEDDSELGFSDDEDEREDEIRELMNLSEDHNVPVKLEEMKSEPNRDGVNFNAVVGLLMSSAIGPQETLQFTYYQFTFQIVTALFRSEGLLNDSNATFYVGMLLNFMSILEATLSLDRDSSYIINLFQAIDYRIPSKTHSILFLVLNTFVEAAYDAETSGTKRIGPCRTRLGYEAIKYYSSKQGLLSRFQSIDITAAGKSVQINDILKKQSFDLQNPIYTLKYLGNIYLGLKLINHSSLACPSQELKSFVLSTVVRYNLRVFANIMILEGWTDELEGAKVEVGFEQMVNNPQLGVDMLHKCSLATPQVLVSKLREDSNKISLLEEVLSKGQACETKVIEILDTLYSFGEF